MKHRGGFKHGLLLSLMELRLQQLGGRVFREYHVAPGRRSGYVDLFAIWPNLRVCVEAEMSAHRVWRDLEKATQLEANLLVILTPDCSVRNSCRRALDDIPSISMIHETLVWVLPLTPAFKQLTDFINAFNQSECP